VVWEFPFRTFFLESFLLPSLLYDPPILVFSFWCPPQCLAPCISCRVHYSILDASIPLVCWAIYSSQNFSFQTCLVFTLTFALRSRLSGFGGLVASVLAFSTQDPGFSGEKILSTPYFGGEVKPFVLCRRFAAC
jgi:hypothetical protein